MSFRDRAEGLSIEGGIVPTSPSMPGSQPGASVIRSRAAFRSAIRHFNAFSDTATKSAGTTLQHYQASLAIKASAGEAMSIKELAEELMLAHNGAAQLVTSMQAQDLVRREGVPEDRRRVSVRLTPKGEALLAQLASAHVAELLRSRQLLVESLRRLDAIDGAPAAHSHTGQASG
jgi:DNA-binding MarR family transcriptional regulator